MSSDVTLGISVKLSNVHFILTSEHAAPSARALHEFAYNSETNGDGVKMFKLGCIRPS